MDNGAYFANKETVFSQEATKCDVLMPWETEFPNLLGMAVAKESVYYEMLMFRTLRQMDMGTWQILTQRMKKGQPICSVDVSASLGIEKLVSVFSIVAFGYILSSAIGIREALLCAQSQIIPSIPLPLLSKFILSSRLYIA